MLGGGGMPYSDVSLEMKFVVVVVVKMHPEKEEVEEQKGINKSEKTSSLRV